MILKYPFHAALACALLLGSATMSQADVLVSENFSYGDGGLNGQNGGTGFGGAWTSSVNVTGGAATGNDPSFRVLSTAFASSGTLWVSFDWGNSAYPSEWNSYGGLTFCEGSFDGPDQRLLIGNVWSYTENDVWGMSGNGGAATTTPNFPGMRTGVAKITLGTGATSSVELWVGPTGSPVDVGGPALATMTGLNLEGVDRIRIMGGDFGGGGNNQSFDNLLIGTTVADVDAIDVPSSPTTAMWSNPAGGEWGTAGNWLGNLVASGSNSTADFSTLDIATDTTVNLESAKTIGHMVFGDTDTTSAAGWVLANNASAANILTLAGTTPTITVNTLGGAKAAAISAVVSGSAGLTKSGPGTLILAAANPYTGGTNINEGTLNLQGEAFSTTPREYVIASGAMLHLDGTMVFATGTTTLGGTGTLRIGGGTLANGIGPGRNLIFGLGSGAVIDIQPLGSIINGGWQTMTWTGNQADLNVDGTFDIWDGQAVFADALTGSGAVAKTHSGNSPTMLNVGIDHGGGIFSGSITNAAGQIAITKQGGGTQVLTGTNTYSGATTINAGVLQIGNGGTSGTLGSGPVTIAGGATLVINRGDDYSPPAGQSISGAGALLKEGAGTLTLSGNSTHTGGTTLNAGTLKAGSNQAFGGSGATLMLNGGSMNLNGYSQTLAAVTGGSSTGIEGGTGLMSVLTLGSGNASSTFGGALSGNLAMVKIGTGTVTLSGPVTMTGILTVKDGTLDLSASTLDAGVRINASKQAVVKLPAATISRLYIENVKLSPGRWGAPGSVLAGLADFESPVFSGPGVVTVADTGPSSQERWKTMKHGFFVHYAWDGSGGVSLNPDGSRSPDINDTADRFDAPGFANDLTSMGVEYVIFTAWHANFFPMYPSSAMDKYHPGRSPNRDMVGDMITAVRAKGIRVLLYTHPYQPINWNGDYLAEHNNLINDVYAELVDRYGDRIDGLFLDENFVGGNQDEYVDYPRLLDTIRSRNPELVLMHNWNENIYACDMMHMETPAGKDLSANPWSSRTTPVPSTQIIAPQWFTTVPIVPAPVEDTVTRSAAGIYRTAVLGAGSCTMGGGWIWGAGPYVGDGYWPVGSGTWAGRWEKGVLEAMQGAAALIAPVAASIKNTYPSTSWLTAPETDILSLPQGIVATRSTDDTREYIHVLNPPGTKTLNLPLPADGKVFTNARLLKNNRAVTIARNARGMSLTLGSSDNWETLNTVIVMDVASPGERSMTNNNDPSVTYTGAWTYGSGRATTEYGQDVHETSTNGNFLEFTFQGTDVELIATCASNRGTADVYIDNVFQESIDLFSTTDVFRRMVFRKSGLVRGPHTLKVVKTGGTFLTIDAFRVTEWINSDDPSIIYSGTWSGKSSATAIGGEVRETNTNNDTLSFHFQGNGIDVIGSRGVGGGTVRFSLNDAYSLSVPQSSNFAQSQALVFTNLNSQTLANGLNKLTVLKLRGAWADVDAFRIYKGSSTPSLRWGSSGGGGTGTWNINSTANWYDGSAATKWLDYGGGDYSAVFGGTAGTVSLASNINVNRLTFQTTGYIVRLNALNLNGPPAIITTPAGTTTIRSAIAGTASLVKAGPGTLKLTSDSNTNTGFTTINEGTLSLIGGAKLYSNLGWQGKTVSVNNGAMLEVDQWDGNGCLGQLDYAYANLVINGGTIRFAGNSNGTAEGQGFTIGADGATLQSDAPAGQTWNINLDTRFAGAYGIASASGGLLSLTGSGNGLLSKVIPGNGGVTKSGEGTWSLTNANSYAGNTTVTSGTLKLGDGTANSGLADAADVRVDGGTLNLNFSGTDTIDELWLGGVQQVPGVYGAGNASGFITGTGTLTVTRGPFESWIDAAWPILSDKTPTGDPDKDGIPNVLEYVLQGGNPSVANTVILPTSNFSGSNFIFTFYRRAAATGTTQLFESSPDMLPGSWSQRAIPGGAGVLVTDQGGGIDKVTITVPEGPGPRIFGRLRVTTPSAAF